MSIRYPSQFQKNLTFVLFYLIFISQLIGQSAMQVAGTATITASTSGNWTNPQTWGGALPQDNDRVLIPNGVEVIVDDVILKEFKSLRIDNGGILKYSANSNTELRVEYLFCSAGGTLEIGNSQNPIVNSNIAKLVFAERGGTSSGEDPNRFAPGAVIMGSVKMQGAEKSSWLALQTHPSMGDNKFLFKTAPVGWAIGDKLVVAGTDPITNTSISSTSEFERDEEITITGISGNEVSFSPALQWDHKAPSQASNLDVHVANLSRNIIISSENSSTISLSGEYQKPRGHLMFMHTLDVSLKYVEADNLGRTDKSIPLDDWQITDGEPTTTKAVANGGKNPRGRYSIHFHRGGLDMSVSPAKPITPLPAPALVEGCVVNGDPGWAYVNHSSRVAFIRNISYNVVGGAFNTEAGNETGSFIENIAIRTVNPINPIMSAPRPRSSYIDGETTNSLADLREERQDFAWQGDGFWLHGTGVTMEGNIVASCTGHAFVYWTDGLFEPNLGVARGDIDAHVPASDFPAQNQALKDWKSTYPNFVLDIWYLQPRPFKNNTAYGFPRGVQTYYTHTEFHRKVDPTETNPDLLMNDLPPSYKDQLDLIFEGTTLWNIGKVGFEHNHSTNITIKDSKIYGYNCRTGFEDYGSNPAPKFVSDEPEVIGLDLDHYHNTHRWKLANNQLEGFSGNSVAVVLPTNGQVTIDGGTFNNEGTDILIGNATQHFVNDNGEGFGVGMLSTAPSKSEVEIKGNMVFQNSAKNIVLDAQIIYDEITQKAFPLINGSKPDPLYFFAPQEITLNFGEFSNSRVYFNEQDGGFIPLVSGTSGNECTISEDGMECVDSKYIGKTNNELKSSFNNSFLGEITPNNAGTHSMIIGGKVTNSATAVQSPTFSCCPVKFYPNPAETSLFVTSEAEHYTAQVVSMDGRVLLSEVNKKGSLVFDVSSLPEGVYLVRIIDQNHMASCIQKVIVQK